MTRRTQRKKSRFKGKTGADAHKQKVRGSQYGHLNLQKGVTVFKEEPGGRAKMDILPYKVTDPKHPDRDDKEEIARPGDLWYKRPYKMHRNVGVNNDTAVCPASVGKKCPICEYRAKRLKEGATYQDDEIKALKPSNRNLYAVVPLGMKDYDEEPHLWDISQFCFQDMLNDELEEDEDNQVFPDPDEGLTLRIRFSSEKIGEKSNPFAKANRIDFEQRNYSYDDDEKLSKVPNLDEALIVNDYGTLENKFYELENEESPEEDVEEDGGGNDEPKQEPESKEDDGYPETWDELKDMDKSQLRHQAKNLSISAKGSEDSLRECIADELGIEEPEPSSDSGTDGEEDECPFGHRFGVDCEEYEECEKKCDLWEKCLEATENNE